MYEGFYGLKIDPFRLSADHRFCYGHRSYARAKAYVQYALYRAEGFVLVTGRPGTGKTTLVYDLLATLPENQVLAGTLVSTQLEAEDLLLMAGHAFGLEFESSQKALVLQRLIDFFNEQHRKGRRALLIVDEAQDLAPSALEELRLLTNLQFEGAPLLQIALLGQDSLREIVRSPGMEQVHQRLIAAWQLEPLTPEETAGYVRHRLERAGWEGDPSFEPGVLEIVYRYSQGVPRRINLICSRLLLHGFIGERHTLTVADAEEVTRDLAAESLALPDRDAEGATPSRGSSDQGRTASMVLSDGDVWKEIDVGLLGPREPATAVQADFAATETNVEAAPARGARPSPATVGDPEGRRTESASASRLSQGHQGEASVALERVVPVHIERDPERHQPEVQRESGPGLGWRGRIGAKSLPVWIALLGIVWLLLLAALLLRGWGETTLPWEVVHRSNDTTAAEPNRGSLPGATLDSRERAVGRGARVEAEGAPVSGRESAPASPATVVPEPEATDSESIPAGVLALSGRVYFRVNSTSIDAQFEPLLDEIAQVLLAHEQAYAEVIGYTDATGALEYNIALSGQRARSVANRLILRGVAAEQLVVEGKGPQDLGSVEAGSGQQRRVVEITVRSR